MVSVQLLAVLLVGVQLASAGPNTDNSITTPATPTDRQALEPLLGKTFKLGNCNLTGVAEPEKTSLAERISKMSIDVMINQDGNQYTITVTLYKKINDVLTEVDSTTTHFNIGEEIKEFYNVGYLVDTMLFTQDGNTLTETFTSGSGSKHVSGSLTYTPQEVKQMTKIAEGTYSCIYKPK